MVDIIDYRNRRDRKFGYKTHTKSAIHFTKEETIDLLKSWVALSFAYYFTFGYFVFYSWWPLVSILPWVTIVAGLTFIVHELSHKFTAQKYGLVAYYKSNDYMLLLSLMISLAGFLFFAPGAVMISGYIDRKLSGITASAGPLSNIIISAIFFPLAILFPWVFFFQVGFAINAWVAMYNMIPFGNFDGRKIYYWSKPVYWMLVCSSVTLVILSYVL